MRAPLETCVHKILLVYKTNRRQRARGFHDRLTPGVPGTGPKPNWIPGAPYIQGESHGKLDDGLARQVVAGAVGGTGAGTILKDLSLGKPGDAITGAVGGGIVGQILNSVLGGGGGEVGGMDVASVVKDIVGGGVGGAVVMAIIGAIRNAMMKR
jgi:hypothetical protein